MRCACAWETASSTFRKRPIRSTTSSSSESQYRSIGTPSTYSRTRYGVPSNVTPASSSRAMCGCVRRARYRPSSSNRRAAAPPPESRNNLIATVLSYRPSIRSARHTEPMPPDPIASVIRYGPTSEPTPATGAPSTLEESAGGDAESSTRPASPILCASSRK